MDNNLPQLPDLSTDDYSLKDKILHHAQTQKPEHEILYAFLTDPDSRSNIYDNTNSEWYTDVDIRNCMIALFDAHKNKIPIESHEVHTNIHAHISKINFDDVVGSYWQGSIHTLCQNYNKQLIRIANIESQQIATNIHLKPEQKTAQIIKLFQTLDDQIAGKKNPTLKEQLRKTAEYLEGCLTGRITFTEWGLRGLDNYMKLRPHCCYFVGALPSAGKTSFAISCIINQCRSGKKIFFYCGEMTEEQIFTRFISQLTMHPLDELENKIESKAVLESRVNEITAAVEEILKWDLHTFCGNKMTLSEIQAKARNIADIDCVWIDYFTDLKPRAHLMNAQRIDIMADHTEQLKAFKLEYPAPIVMLAQLKRDAIDRYPRKEDLAESSTCEQSADGVLLIDRPIKGKDVNERNYWVNNRKISLDELIGKVALVIGKNRFGVECPTVFDFYGPLMQFKDENPDYAPVEREEAKFPTELDQVVDKYRKDIDG